MRFGSRDRLAIVKQLVPLMLGALAACGHSPPVVPKQDASSAAIAPTSAITAKPAVPTSSAIESLTQTPEDDLFPRVSQNGLIVFQRETLDAELNNAAVFGLSSEEPVRQLSPTGKVATAPALSPDGSTIVFVSNALGPLALLKTTLAPGAPLSVVISSDRAPELGEPALSPDGRLLAFSMKGPSGVRTLATIGIDGSKLTPLFPGRSPAFRPDGKALVFVASKGGYNHVFEREFGEGAAERALTAGEFDCDHPSYSPDGQAIVFSANLGFQEFGAPRESFLRIFTQRVGQAPVALTPNNARSGTPYWAADGHIYFSSTVGSHFDLARVRPPG
jgi:Tol biopolymer transport system component